MPLPNSWSSLLRSGKDRLTAGGLRTLLNMKLERYARVDRLELDSAAKTLRLTLRLNGEEERPLVLAVDGWELLERAGEWLIRIQRARCERPWLQNLLEDQVIGREVKIPAKLVGVLRAIL